MSVLLADFWKRLIQSGLVDSAAPARWVKDFARDHGAEPPENAAALCQWLVEKGRITRFQGQMLLSDSWSPKVKLRIPPVTRTAFRAATPFSQWIPVTHDKLGPARLVVLPSERLQPVDGGRLREHAAVNHPSLAQLELVPLPQGPPATPDEGRSRFSGLPSVGWLTPLPKGCSLAEYLRQNRVLPGPVVAQVLEQVAAALAELHSTGLTHGHVSVDRVWRCDDGQVQLWRDPGAILSDSALGWPDGPSLGRIGDDANPPAPQSRWLIDQTADAPLIVVPEWRGELTAGEQPLAHSSEARCFAAATPASDIFLAGALGYRLRTGRPLPILTQTDGPIELPAEVNDAVQAGAQGDPLDRVLAYALATDPSQRFPSAQQFAAAVAAAGKALQKSPRVSGPRKQQSADISRTEVAEPAKSKTPASPPPVTNSPEKNPPGTNPPGTTNPPGPKPPEPVMAKAAIPRAAETKAAVSSAPPQTSSEPPSAPPPPTPPPTPTPPAAAKAPTPADQSPPPAPATEPPATPPPAANPVDSQVRDDVDPVVDAAAVTATPVGTTIGPPATELSTSTTTVPDAETVAATGTTPGPTSGTAAASVPGSASTLRARRRRRRNQTAVYVLGAMCVPILLLFIALLVQEPPSPQASRRIRPPAPDVLPSVRSTRSMQPSPPAVKRPVPPASTPDPADGVIESENLLWASPERLRAMSPDPADQSADARQETIRRRKMLSLLPPGAAAVASIRLAELRRLGWIDTFDSELSPWLNDLPKRVGVPLEEIQRISFALFPGSDGRPEWAMAVHLNQTKPISELLDAWEASAARGPGGVSLFAGNEPDSPAYYALAADALSADAVSASGQAASGENPALGSPDADQANAPAVASGDDPVASFAVGSIEQITAVAEAGGAPVLLPRLLEQLWVTVDPDDAATLLAVPNFLVADARGWMNDLAPPAIPWIRQNLIPACSGLLVRVATAPPMPGQPSDNGSTDSYFELRLATAPGTDPAVLNGKVRRQLLTAPETAEDFFVTRDIDSSWRLLASRLPAMWAFLTAQTRSGMVDRHVVFNAYLPPSALPQATLATLLAANTPAAAGQTAPADPSTRLTVAQMLDRPMSISFDQESLQFAIETIAQQFAEDLPPGNQMPKIEIIGGDLQKMGITQNQQIRDFSKRDLPLRTVLTDLLLGANPDRTATGPKDPKQALIWVLAGEGEDAEIRVTTRQAAEGQYELPEEFVIPE